MYFITSITSNKIIYLLVQVDNYLKIYRISDLNSYHYRTPDMLDGSSEKTITGDMSFCGINTYNNYLPYNTSGGASFFLDFIPCELSNTLVSEVDISKLLGIQSLPPIPETYASPLIDNGSYSVPATTLNITPPQTLSFVGNGSYSPSSNGSFSVSTPSISITTPSTLSFVGNGSFSANTTELKISTTPVAVITDVGSYNTLAPGEYEYQLSDDGMLQWVNGVWGPRFQSGIESAPETGDTISITSLKDDTTLGTASIYILGDGDDLFVQKPSSTKYKHNKRYSTHSTMSIGSTVYVPITCRVNHPTGRLFTFVLGFFSDGSVGIVDNDNIPIQMVTKPMGRTQFLYKDGKYVMSTMKMVDGEKEFVSYDDLKKDITYGDAILKNLPDSFNSIFNTFAKKKWIIGEYDVKVTDNLNVRENL